LNEGKLDGSTVTCPWRGSQFDVCTGAVLQGPAVGISKEIPVSSLLTAPGGALWVGTDSGFACMPSTVVHYFDRSLVIMYHPGVGSSVRIACLLIRNGILWVGTSRGLYWCLSAFKPPA
jgi:ligand-binding sensor domain-containing protein